MSGPLFSAFTYKSLRFLLQVSSVTLFPRPTIGAVWIELVGVNALGTQPPLGREGEHLLKDKTFYLSRKTLKIFSMQTPWAVPQNRAPVITSQTAYPLLTALPSPSSLLPAGHSQHFQSNIPPRTHPIRSSAVSVLIHEPKYTTAE